MNLVLSCLIAGVWQHGQRGRRRAIPTVNRRLVVGIENGACRSDRRVGGIFAHWKAECAGPTSGGPDGLASPHDKEAVSGQRERDMVMEAPPAPPLVIAETDFLLEVAIALLDPPAVFGGGDHRLDRRVPGQRDQPVS